MKHKAVGELTVAPSSANVDKANVGDLVVWNNIVYMCKVETIGSAVFEKQSNETDLTALNDLINQLAYTNLTQNI